MNIFFDANICLDFLDAKRPTSPESIDYFLRYKDDEDVDFYFSSDFISTFYYILTEKKKIDPTKVIGAIDALSFEITPFYLAHSDFVNAKSAFYEKILSDFEDLMVLESAYRANTDYFVTNDKELLAMKNYKKIRLCTH